MTQKQILSAIAHFEIAVDMEKNIPQMQPVEVIYGKNCKCCKGTGRLVGKGIYVRGVVCDCPKCGGTGKAPNRVKDTAFADLSKMFEEKYGTAPKEEPKP